MNITKLLNTTIANRIADINICIPAKIVSYNYKNRKSSVKPLLNTKYNDGQELSLPIIPNVPVVHPSGGGASITFPVKKEDIVLLVFSQRSLEEFLENGKEATPDDPRKNDLTDAIAILGLQPFSSEVPANSADDFVVDYDGTKIEIHPSGEVDITATEINITATNVNVTGKLKATNLEAEAEMKSQTALIGGKDFATHQHTGVTSGGSNTGVVA